MIDDLPLGQALGPCGTDVVGVQHLQHIGAGIAHQGTDADDHQRHDGQHQMMRLVPKLTGRRQLLVVTADETVQVEPAQLHGKDQLQQGRKEERRQGDTGQRKNRDGIVRLAVLLGGSQHAQGDGNDDLQNEGDTAHDEGQPHRVVKLLEHRHRIQPAVTEVASEHLAQPRKKAGNDPAVHMIHLFQLSQPLLIALGAGRHGLLLCHSLDVGRRETAHQAIDDERNKEQDHNGNQYSFQNIFSHKFNLRSDDTTGRRRSGAMPQSPLHIRQRPAIFESHFPICSRGEPVTAMATGSPGLLSQSAGPTGYRYKHGA